MEDKIVIIGAGVSGINAATKLVDNGYPGELITIIDKGKDPHNRLPEEVMEGMLGAGGWSDGKLVVSTTQGGHMSKYCGEDKAIELMEQVVANFTKFHPNPEFISKSDPKEDPDFIQPYFELKKSLVWHIGSNYLHEIAKNWYGYLIEKGVKFEWLWEVKTISFNDKIVWARTPSNYLKHLEYNKLIFGVGKSGIDFGSKLNEQYKLPSEPKPAQIGVRFEAPQKYFQKLIDVAYDFKLYQKKDNVSIRTFCTNNNAAYVAVEETYGDISYNGHAKKGDEFQNDMTNFGILMEIKGIEDPFEWSREIVGNLQAEELMSFEMEEGKSPKNFKEVNKNIGLYFSPERTVSKTSEGEYVSAFDLSYHGYQNHKKHFKGYFKYIENFIEDLNTIFDFRDDWGIYLPEVKYLNPEPLVNYKDLSLTDYPNVHFTGDILSARGITVSGAQGIYVAEGILENQ